MKLMLDHVYAWRNKRRQYKPIPPLTEYIESRRYLPIKGAQTLTLVLPPWHDGGNVQRKMEAKILKSGSAVLAYCFTEKILRAELEPVVDSYNLVINHMKQDIEQLVQSDDYEHIDIIGLSLGNAVAAILATLLPQTRRIDFVLAGSTLAEALWFGLRTTNIRKQFEAQGVTLEQLKTAWAPLAPINYIAPIEHLDVRIVLARYDRFIPYRFGRLYADSFTIKPRVKVYQTGHMAAAANFCLRRRV